MAIQHATDSTFQGLLQIEGVAVVNFWAAWCGPCKMFAPVLEEFEREANDSIRVIKVNVDENPITSDKFQIMSIPTTIIFKDGKLIYKEPGILPKSVLAQLTASEWNGKWWVSL
ncbi:thioredoxin [Paenibacillus faecis]|uniref:Thioredoxin n=1 Tax=Paenibacillus faecis TaxID=862114 RepID=A0A5D0CZR3_9BACL|nr:thioredoxin [Paenibacillus faecis]TYA14784.1 thioredoxin [Paenibacillus faecis]